MSAIFSKLINDSFFCYFTPKRKEKNYIHFYFGYIVVLMCFVCLLYVSGFVKIFYDHYNMLNISETKLDIIFDDFLENIKK